MAATANEPLFPTVTVSLAGFVVIDGAEVGVVGSGGGGGAFTFPTKPVQPDRNNAGNARSMKKCKILAQ